jgi:hypothetical protein
LNIIFGKQEADELRKKYIVLELDTITIKNSAPTPVYCVVENISIEQLTKAENYIKMHADLIENYKNRNWDFCQQTIEQLMGFWGGQVDSFYEILNARLAEYKENEPDESWTGIIHKG